ncbi:MAG: SDR family oxidoreductase [Alphaproteobacteria bacterium]|nr:SDR family oxidoreductase [Alphaproteobacteria bacterium]
MELKKIALVTGAGKRIGRSIALDLAKQNWSLIIHYHNSAEEAEEVAHTIITNGGQAYPIKANLFHENEVKTLIPKAIKFFGSITCLINNASIFEFDSIHTANTESWHKHMEINLHAPFILSQDFAKQEINGNIINILDQRVLKLTPYFVSYTVSKMGLWTLTRTLALALAPKIRVNAIGPGPTLQSIHQTEQEFLEQCYSMPLHHGATLDDINNTIQFILNTPALTGQIIALDGGEHLGWIVPGRKN